jgi:hypothetical protein
MTLQKSIHKIMSQEQYPNCGKKRQREVIVPTPPSQKPNVEPKPRPVIPEPKPNKPLIPNQPPKPGKQING